MIQKGEYSLKNDVSVRQALQNMVKWDSANDNVKLLSDWVCFDDEYAGDIEDLSTFWNVQEDFNLDDFGVQDMFVQDQRGFGVILNQMFAELESNPRCKIYFEHKVVEIDYGN